MMHKKVAGLTLVELMVALAILAILVAIGYPMYADQIRKSTRSDARGAVMELAMAEDRHEAVFGEYAEDADIPGLDYADGIPTPDPDSTFVLDVTRIVNEYRDSFDFNITADDDTYTITARPTGDQVNDEDCVLFSIDQTGLKYAENSGGADNTDRCW